MENRRPPEPDTADPAGLDARTCRMICPIASAMVGVCMTGIGLLRVAASVRAHKTIADDLLSVDALLFLLATLTSYFALRVQSSTRLHGLEWVADKSFILAMSLLTVACFVITYSLGE
jgi:hypothetical protein